MSKAKIETVAEITKINRAVNKEMATVTISIPAETSGKLPMGRVNITIEEVQTKMF